MLYSYSTIYIHGLTHDYNNLSALAMELLQSCTNPSNRYSVDTQILWQILHNPNI